MKKLVIFNPSIEGGGVEKNIEMISNHLSNKYKKRIYFVSYDYSLKLNKSINFVRPIIKLNIKNRLFKYLICIISLLNFYKNNKNFVIFSFQANVYAILVAKILNLKIIVRANAAPHKWISNYKILVLRYFYNLADKVIVNSYEFKKEVEKVLNVKPISIYNPIDTKKILSLSKKKNSFPFFDKDNNSLKVLNIGRLTLQKNQIDLLKIVSILKKKIPIKLLIIGSGPEENNLKNYIIKNKLTNLVRIISYNKNPYVFYKKANVFILTSLYEGLPNVLLEATLFKLFCISYKCKSGPKEILDGGKGGILINVNNYNKITKELIKYYYFKKKTKYKKMINLSFKNLKKYNLKNQLLKYEKIISFYLK